MHKPEMQFYRMFGLTNFKGIWEFGSHLIGYLNSKNGAIYLPTCDPPSINLNLYLPLPVFYFKK